jgi:beta-lactam-binding protein with PASTA domain
MQRRRVDLLLGIVLGVVLGIAIVAVFVFVFSEDTVDAPSIDNPSERQAPAQP